MIDGDGLGQQKRSKRKTERMSERQRRMRKSFARARMSERENDKQWVRKNLCFTA